MCVALGIFLAGGTVFGENKDDISYPVENLGNCANEKECETYCNAPEHLAACLAFAEVHNLLSVEDIAKAKKFQEAGAVGPGDCGTEKECEAYCSAVSHIDECLAFAEKHGFMESKDLEDAKKISRALREGARLPGGCATKDQCELYCENSGHMKECVVFAEKAGFMDEEELREAKQVLKALESGAFLPGNCQGKKACEAYCADSSHMEECLNFGVAAGFILPEEEAEARRILPLMKAGKMPGDCQRGREACEAYCSQDEHREECALFFVEAGFMTKEEVSMFKKTGGKGPGGCRGKEQCDALCNNPENQSVCFEFAKEHGLIPEEELENMKEGIGKFKEGIAMAPPEVAQCLGDRIGQDVLDKIRAGTFLPNPDLGEEMRRCFEEFLPDRREGDIGAGGNDVAGGEPFGQNSGEGACLERILGPSRDRSVPPTPEQERRLAEECFPERESDRLPFQEQSRDDFREGSLEFSDEGIQVSPEDILRREEMETTMELRQRIMEEETRRMQMEVQLQEQFQHIQQLQESQESEDRRAPSQEFPAGGSVIDAFLGLFGVSLIK